MAAAKLQAEVSFNAFTNVLTIKQLSILSYIIVQMYTLKNLAEICRLPIT